jgi:hypothetical protein
MKAKILKKLTHDGKELEQGAIVDVSGWRNVNALESLRYITFISEEPKTVDSKTKKISSATE